VIDRIAAKRLETSRPLERLGEAAFVDLERDLVGILGRASASRLEEHEHSRYARGD